MKKNNKTPPKIPIKKLICGLVVFVLAFSAPLLIPLIIKLNISTALKTIISGTLIFGIPELGMLLAVIILGKDGFVYLKSQIFFWMKKTVSSGTVSRTRYHIGIMIFSVTLILGFLIPYINYFLPAAIQGYQYLYTFSADLLFFISLFILGGNFWDKLKSLFRYDIIISTNTD